MKFDLNSPLFKAVEQFLISAIGAAVMAAVAAVKLQLSSGHLSGPWILLSMAAGVFVSTLIKYFKQHLSPTVLINDAPAIMSAFKQVVANSAQVQSVVSSIGGGAVAPAPAAKAAEQSEIAKLAQAVTSDIAKL